MRVWQEPGEEVAAHWRCASSDPGWKERGGVWYRPVGETAYAAIVVVRRKVPSTEAHGFYSYLQRYDLSKITLPEVRDLLDVSHRFQDGHTAGDFLQGVPDWEERLAQGAVAKGYGLVVSAATGQSAKHVRSLAKKLLEAGDTAWSAPVVPDHLNVHHRRWEKIREAHPIDYAEGFLSGMQRRDRGEEENEAYLAGWRHGWEYAVGRVPLPGWFIQSAAKESV